MSKPKVGDILWNPTDPERKYLVCQHLDELCAVYLHNGEYGLLYVERTSTWLNGALKRGYKVIGNILEDSNGTS